MKLGYMTNAFGLLVGSGGGVTSVKDIRYETICDDSEVIRKIADYGFNSIEMFDGNLERFENNQEELKEILGKNKVSLLGVYVGANYIYRDALEDELWHIEKTAKLAAELGASHIVLGGGAIRASGIRDEDYTVLASGLDKANEVIKKYGLIASFHPHLGSMVESPEQIDKLFSLTTIPFCPDLAHIAAGGGDPLKIIEKYYDRIKYVHLKDLKGNEFVPLGDGDLEIGKIVNFLNGKKYKGDWLVEIDGYTGDPEEACIRSYKFLENKLGVVK